jgi:hypothetical protein
MHHRERYVPALEVAHVLLDETDPSFRKELLDALPPLAHEELLVYDDERRHLQLGDERAREDRFSPPRARSKDAARPSGQLELADEGGERLLLLGTKFSLERQPVGPGRSLLVLVHDLVMSLAVLKKVLARHAHVRVGLLPERYRLRIFARMVADLPRHDQERVPHRLELRDGHLVLGQPSVAIDHDLH